jgi:ubiquitin carboxyl-terminal hydrolase 47
MMSPFYIRLIFHECCVCFCHRLALFQWKYDEAVHGEGARCLSRQLQKLFAQLQLSERPAITTGALTKSFGWTSSDAFVQQDVHECLSVMFEFLGQQSIGI